ncbi:MAG TPA: maleylpyruvate isomerase N-terminal domain-containing protein [Friedmanniella sp.]
MRVPHPEGRDAFVGALDGFLGAVGPLDDHALLAASRCWGWTVVDVVTHVRLGLEEVASCLLTAGTCSGAPDRDAATYWLTEPPDLGTDEVAGILAIRRLASATRVPRSALVPLTRVSDALVLGVARLPDGALAFQGGVLTTGDLLATWAVELAVHQLDLAREIDVAPPSPDALAMARRTVEALRDAGRGLPAFAERL